MIEVGESTGALPAMLNSVAEFYEEDVQTALTAAMSLIEPAILIVMGVIVAFVLLSLYLPIFTLGSAYISERFMFRLEHRKTLEVNGISRQQTAFCEWEWGHSSNGRFLVLCSYT